MPQTAVAPRCRGEKHSHEHLVVLRDGQAGTWRILSRPCRIVTTNQASEVASCLREVEHSVATQGLIAAGFVAYEAASAFDAALVHHDPGDFPLLWFALYPAWSNYHLKTPRENAPDLHWQASLGQEAYGHCLQRVHRYIASGDTYQVNYSYRLSTPFQGSAFSLFCQLATGHDPEYGAYLHAGDWELVSLSPELFFCREGDLLTSIPMKGTFPRGLSAEDDRAQGRRLRESLKNRAENVMIVDMVRNDLGRIAVPGSVRVESLFATQRHPTLWQMTSSVSGQVRSSLTDIFSALFPAASITGAPKARTMELIRELEYGPRRIYTGSIGFLLPDGRAQFNVAIRTLLHDRRRRRLEYGVGGGIVADSSIDGEWEETRTKSLAVKPLVAEFSLLETMRWRPGEGIFLLERHLHRLRNSAEYFSYPCDLGGIRDQLAKAVANLPAKGCKLRLLLDRFGRVSVKGEVLPTRTGSASLRLVAAKSPVESNDPFLYHKTTRRQVYEQARAAAPRQADDVILYNHKGELTETTIANIVLVLGGRRCTPPVRCGLLAGTLRQQLLESGDIEERCLKVEDLEHADSIVLINSVRGEMAAVLWGNDRA